MNQKKRQPTLAGMVVAAWMVVLVISNLVIGFIGYSMHRSEQIHARAEEAENVAVAMAVRIDGDQFTEIMSTMEKNDYWYEVKSYADRISEVFSTAFIYILDGQYGDEVTYFAEGAPEDAPYDLGMTEAVDVFGDEMFETLRTGESSASEPYTSGDYGDMVSGFAPIFNAKGEVVGVVGVDFFFDNLLYDVNIFGLWLILAIVLFAIFCYVFMLRMGTQLAGKPLDSLDVAAQRMALGDMDFQLDIKSRTEIGRLAKSFNSMIHGMKTQIHALETLANGDLSIDVKPRSEKDTMTHAMLKMIASLNTTFTEINGISLEVAENAKEVAESSLSLAQGATEQTAAVAALGVSISKVADKTMESASMAIEAAELGDTIKVNAEKGTQQMEQMMDAVKQINDASNSISKVISVIDSIAFQTNILALNAAVEAARAGQHGKGFAVVAEEVRNLARKSADAAKDTGALIANSMEKAALGAKIAEATSASLAEIVSGINENSRIVKIIAESSENQTSAIKEINSGISQVGEVVHLISKGAELSSGASFSMKDESNALSTFVSGYKLKETGNQPRLPK